MCTEREPPRLSHCIKGGKPSEIPIQTPEQLVLAINLATAKTIGLDIPPRLLERAERVVE